MNETGRSGAGKVLPLVSVVTFIGFFDNNLLIPIITLYAAGLGAGVGIIGLIVGLYSLTNTAFNIVFGRLIDRIGYKYPLVAGLLGDALSMFLYTLCRLPVHLALVRMLHGTTGASIGPAPVSAIAANAGEEQKGRAMGLYGMAIGLATLVGFGLSGFIVSRLGYRAVFLLGAAFSMVGMVLGLFLPRRPPSPRPAKAAAGDGWEKARDLLKRRGLLVSYGAIFAQHFAFGGMVTLLPLYMKGLGLGAFHVGMVMAAFSVVFIVLQFPSGIISDRGGRLSPIAVSLGLGGRPLVAVPLVREFWLIVAAMALYGLAYGVLLPSPSALRAGDPAPEERGAASGIFHALLTAGIAIGAPVMGWVGSAAGVPPALALSATVMVAALVAALIMLKRV